MTSILRLMGVMILFCGSAKSQDVIVVGGNLYGNQEQLKDSDKMVLLVLKANDLWSEVKELVQSEPFINFSPQNYKLWVSDGEDVPLVTMNETDFINAVENIKQSGKGDGNLTYYLELTSNGVDTFPDFKKGKPAYFVVYTPKKVKYSTVVALLCYLQKEGIKYTPVDAKINK